MGHGPDDCPRQSGKGGDVAGVGRGRVDGALCVVRPVWRLRYGCLQAAPEAVVLAVTGPEPPQTLVTGLLGSTKKERGPHRLVHPRVLHRRRTQQPDAREQVQPDSGKKERLGLLLGPRRAPGDRLHLQRTRRRHQCLQRCPGRHSEGQQLSQPGTRHLRSGPGRYRRVRTHRRSTKHVRTRFDQATLPRGQPGHERNHHHPQNRRTASISHPSPELTLGRLSRTSAAPVKATEPPTITAAPAVSSASCDDLRTPGETLEATLTFSEAATVDTTGGTVLRTANHLRGAGTTELAFGLHLVANALDKWAAGPATPLLKSAVSRRSRQSGVWEITLWHSRVSEPTLSNRPPDVTHGRHESIFVKMDSISQSSSTRGDNENSRGQFGNLGSTRSSKPPLSICPRPRYWERLSQSVKIYSTFAERVVLWDFSENTLHLGKDSLPSWTVFQLGPH